MFPDAQHSQRPRCFRWSSSLVEVEFRYRAMAISIMMGVGIAVARLMVGATG